MHMLAGKHAAAPSGLVWCWEAQLQPGSFGLVVTLAKCPSLKRLLSTTSVEWLARGLLWALLRRVHHVVFRGLVFGGQAWLRWGYKMWGGSRLGCCDSTWATCPMFIS